MTHTERINLFLAGKPIDRVPYSAWGHVFNYCDRNPKDFANATIQLQNSYEFDFIKMMSNAYYMVEDSGVKLQPVKNYATPVSRDYDEIPIRSSSDWKHVNWPKAGKGVLAREKEAIQRVLDYYQGDVPVVATIFTPLTNLQYMTIPSRAIDEAYEKEGSYIPLVERYLLEHKSDVKDALERMEEANRTYMEDLLSVGVSGFFYCTDFARGYWEDPDHFAEFCAPYDLRTLRAVTPKAKLNQLHVCGHDNLKFEWVKEYPVNILNWEDSSPKNPSLKEMREQSDLIFMGGLDRHHVLEGCDREEIKKRLKQQIAEAREGAKDRLILSGGCDWNFESVSKFFIWKEVMEEMLEQQ